MLLFSAIYACQSFQKKNIVIIPEIHHPHAALWLTKKIIQKFTAPVLLSNAINACQSF